MPWRVIAHDNQVWHVEAVAERRAHTQAWQLVLTFRAAAERPRGRSLWTLFPLEATSKSALFIQAERIPDAALAQGFSERLGPAGGRASCRTCAASSPPGRGLRAEPG